MTKILAIESSGPVCSAACFMDGKLVDSLEEKKVNTHAELLAVFCDRLIETNGKPDAISLSTGPGSYTGLRIGTSLAKGLAFGFGIPVIGLSELDCMAESFLLDHEEFDFVVPTVDARRMEVYQRVYQKGAESSGDITPLIVDKNAWSEFDGMKAIIGDGAAKLGDLLAHRKDILIFDSILPSAKHQLQQAFRKFANREFLDLAYFEPFYLKEFIALTANKQKHAR
ncbi:MAG: tRNA (adenosine(37)-N6)-threonylcarbamoyltransferase complex dimerization subunit type 1 TsaB [Bacteroidetes bacterium]|nr:tRNA (adenosine(37)-N6)-threonylcarbamoyltransferase complex dimerization subunit type 1 TsaB [Bacteroidota bacterium]